MAITQIIATLPAVLNDSETFYEDIAVRNNSLVTVSFPSVNAWATQANALAVEVNAKALQVASQAVDGGYNQTYINTNFVGVNNAQTIAEIKTFSSNPLSTATQSTNANALTKYSAVVKNSGDETIAGIKTFSSTISGSINGNASTVTNGVYTTGDQTIEGVKAFSSSPIVPTPTAGDNSTKVATTAFVLANFTASLAANGYQKLPGGLIIQWGTMPYTSDNGNATITFPITFPTVCVSIVPSIDTVTNGAGNWSVYGKTTTYFSANYSSTVVSSASGYYIAVGY